MISIFPFNFPITKDTSSDIVKIQKVKVSSSNNTNAEKNLIETVLQYEGV